jgi:hypothetical protein
VNDKREKLLTMEPRKAFWLALITVGVPFFIWGRLLYLLGIRAADWLVYLVFAVLPGLGFFVFVFLRYLTGPEQEKKLTRRQRIVRAIISGCVAMAFLAVALLNQRSSWRAVPYWGMVAGWLIITADHLRYSYKARETDPAKS